MGYKDPTIAPERHFGMPFKFTGIHAYASPYATMSISNASPVESDIVNGGWEFVINIHDGILIDDGFDDVRQDIIDGMTSPSESETGWNATVRDAMSVSAVERISDTRVVITLPAAADYEITEDEKFFIQFPASAIWQGKRDVTVEPSVLVGWEV